MFLQIKKEKQFTAQEKTAQKKKRTNLNSSHLIHSNMLVQRSVNPHSDEIRNLVDVLNQSAYGNWAFTGSFSLYLHSERSNLKPKRTPNDVDILVETRSFNSVLSALYRTYENRVVRPTGGAISRLVNAGSFKIDVINAGQGFGNFRNIEMYNYYPIVPIKELIHRKEDIRQESFLPGIKKEQAKEDLDDLKDIQRPNRGLILPSIPNKTPASAERMQITGFSLNK